MTNRAFAVTSFFHSVFDHNRVIFAYSQNETVLITKDHVPSTTSAAKHTIFENAKRCSYQYIDCFQSLRTNKLDWSVR